MVEKNVVDNGVKKKKFIDKIKYFIFSFQGKIILIMSAFIILTLSIYLFTSYRVNYNIMFEEKKSKLLGYSNTLVSIFGDLSYQDILENEGATNKTREEKIQILNTYFKDRTELISKIDDDLGVGYYSLELDAIITYGPASEFSSLVGSPISQGHQGRVVMSTNTSKVIQGVMARGKILNAMVPIVINGEVIGYAWANETTAAIENQFARTTRSTTILFISVFVIIFIITILVTTRLFKDVTKITTGIKILHNDINHRLVGINGEFGVVAESINNMAESIKNAEDEKEAYLLSEASRKAQKDFLARMSHEIRTPMNGVLGMTRMALQTDEPEKKREYLQKIQQSASLLLGIINDILDFSKIEAGKLELDYHPFKLNEVVGNIQELISPKLVEKDLEFKISLDPECPKDIIGDSLRISQILLNLLGNSAKFTSEGYVSLNIKLIEKDDKKVKILFAVSDTGIGMNSEQVSNLFQPFMQADTSTARKFGGTGLGLSISKALVEQMGSKLIVESEIGKGTSFSFELLALIPILDVEKDFEQLSFEFLPKQYKGIKALLVEDNEINQEIAVALLSEYNLDIDLANNGEEAITKYNSNYYDIIFMDIQMPIMDGLQATREIRLLEVGKNTHIPIIAMTANAMEDDRLATKNAGMDEHVSKPFEMKELNNVLSKVYYMIKK